MKADGYETIHSGFGYGQRNNGGLLILDFAIAFKLIIANSYFKKKEGYLVTFKGGITKTQIDYFPIQVNNRRICKDCKVSPSEYLGT